MTLWALLVFLRVSYLVIDQETEEGETDTVLFSPPPQEVSFKIVLKCNSIL